jgi:UDP-N-acetylmuramate--alanine ligase
LPLQQTQSKQISYSIDVNAQAMALNIRILQSNYYFDYQFGDVAFKSLQLGLPGRHNIENAVAAITAGLQYGLNEQHIREALQSYKGVKRRFEKIVANSKVQFIDDYAHHPEELRATILSAKELNPDKNTTVVFQPHLFSRTRDFANAFSDVLSLADQVILLPIYPARELPISGVTSQILADKITTEVTLCNKDALIDVLKTMHIEGVVNLRCWRY